MRIATLIISIIGLTCAVSALIMRGMESGKKDRWYTKAFIDNANTLEEAGFDTDLKGYRALSTYLRWRLIKLRILFWSEIGIFMAIVGILLAKLSQCS